jgi:DNA mismatch repair protein MutS
MRQYLEVKSRYADSLLFFRLGDFYEMFYDDAVYVARVLGLTLTSRDKGKEDAVPMCGVPHHAAQGYIAKLTELGHRVALCEQLEDPRTVKGIVKRDVVRVITPGVIIDEETLDPRTPNFVAAVAGEARDGYAVAFADVTTGDFRGTWVQSREALIDELARIEPNELVIVDGDTELPQLVRKSYGRLPQSKCKDAAVTFEQSQTFLFECLGGGFDKAVLAKTPPLAVAAARVLKYARDTQVASPLPISRFEVYRRDDHLIIDGGAEKGLLVRCDRRHQQPHGRQVVAPLAAFPPR